MRMHPNEIETDADLVRRLLDLQFPAWAERDIERVPSAGTDNAMYRLGDDLAVRLPKIHWALDSILKERHWIPRIAPRLPFAVPLPVGEGAPTDEYQHRWNVVQWLPGATAPPDAIDRPAVADDLVRFLEELRGIDACGGPTHTRGKPLGLQDPAVQKSIAALDGEIDAAAFSSAWQQAIAAPDYDGEPVWFHGDLAYLNVLSASGRVAGIIDWGLCGVGDPAIDLLPAWSFFTRDNRRRFRTALDVDDAMWARGKGWALAGITGIPYYRKTNPVLVADKIRAIEAVLADDD